MRFADLFVGFFGGFIYLDVVLIPPLFLVYWFFWGLWVGGEVVSIRI